MASSSWWPRAISAVRVIMERLRRSSPGRVQMRAPGVRRDQFLEVPRQVGDRGVRPGRHDHRRAPRGGPPSPRRTAPAACRPRRRPAVDVRPAGHVLVDQLGDQLRCLGGGQVGDLVEDDQPAVLDAEGDLLQQRRRGGHVLVAGDGQHRHGDLTQPVADVEVGQRVADLGVTLAIGVLQRMQQPGRHLGVRDRKPSANQRSAERGDHDRRARAPDLLGPLVPPVLLADLGPRAEQHGTARRRSG